MQLCSTNKSSLTQRDDRHMECNIKILFTVYASKTNQEGEQWELLYLHEEEPRCLYQPASMSLARGQLHPLRSHTTSCTKCHVLKWGLELHRLKHLGSCVQLYVIVVLNDVPCNQQALASAKHHRYTTNRSWPCLCT